MRVCALAGGVALVLGCGGGEGSAGPSELGTIIVSNVTSGGLPIDPSGYTVSLNGSPPAALPLNGFVGFGDLVPRDYLLDFGFAGVAANCAIDGPYQRGRTLAAGERAEVILNVTCSQAPPAGHGLG